MSGDFDRAVDRVIREMLDAEPRADVRARVVARIESPRPRWKNIWFAAPAAAAAAIVIAIVLLPRPQTPLASHASASYAPPVESVAPVFAAVERAAPTRVAPQQTIRAAVVDHALPPAENDVIAPLAAPAPISMTTIASGTSTPVVPMQVAPINVEPLEVNALSETPDDRREE